MMFVAKCAIQHIIDIRTREQHLGLLNQIPGTQRWIQCPELQWFRKTLNH